MLRKSSIDIANSYAAQLVQNNVVVIPMPNTVLNNLVGYSVPLNYKTNSSASDQFASIIEMNTTGTLDNPTDHDKESDSIIESLSKIVSQHINFARSVVKPLDIELGDKLNEYLSANKEVDPGNNFNIDIIDIPELLNDDTFLNSIAYGKDRNPLIPNKVVNLGDKTIEEINTYILTGSDSINKKIAAWLSEKNSTFITDIWNGLFGNGNSNINYSFITALDPFTKSHYLLAIYLIASGAIKNVEKNADVSLTDYKANIQEIIDYAVRSLAETINKINGFNATKILVLGTDKKNNTIKVNKNTYEDWVNQGNEPEILFGMLTSGEMISSITLLENKKETYKQNWEVYCKMYRFNEKQKRLTYAKDFLNIIFFDSMKTVSDIEKDYINKSPEYFSIVKKLAEKEIDLITEKDLYYPYDISRKLVAKCRFYYTSSYNILNDINNNTIDNKEIDIREAALISTINYICDYLSDQISISK